MKIFRVLMIVAFMFSAAGTGVVQAAGERVGFIRLVSGIDTRTPIQIQAGQAFQRMLPRLLALQKQGSIQEFEPELMAGIVKVRYASDGANLSAIGGNQIYAGIHESIVSAPRQAPPLQQPRTAATPIFGLELYDSCFSAANLGAFSDVVGSLRDKTGRAVASYEGFADPSGSIALDCFPWSGSYTDVAPGYTVTFKVYDTTPVLLGTYTVVAPVFSFTSIDQATAQVSGAGPAGRPFEIDWYHRNWDAADTSASSMKGGLISSAGVWSKDMGAMTFRGDDELDLFVLQNPYFEFGQMMKVPYLYCQIGGNFCGLSGFAFQPATVSIVHAGNTYPFSGTFDAFGYFEADLQNAGVPISLRAGDTISGSNVTTDTLPFITIAVNFNTNMVKGKIKASPYRYFELLAYTLCSCTSYLLYSRLNHLSQYSGDFTSQVDLVNGQATNIEVYFMNLKTGNITDYVRSYGP